MALRGRKSSAGKPSSGPGRTCAKESHASITRTCVVDAAHISGASRRDAGRKHRRNNARGPITVTIPMSHAPSTSSGAFFCPIPTMLPGMSRVKEPMFYSAVTPPRILTLILLTATSTLSLTMFLPSLANMAVDFQVDYAVVSLSIAGYLAVTAVVQLIVGPLSDRYGRRPVLLTTLATFALASVVCALATDIWVFLGFRILQGVVISSWTLSQAAIRDMAPPQEAASLMGYVAMAMAIAPMLAPLFGGVLDELFGWRASFLAFTGMGVALLFYAGSIWVKRTRTHRRPSPSSFEHTPSCSAYRDFGVSRSAWRFRPPRSMRF